MTGLRAMVVALVLWPQVAPAQGPDSAPTLVSPPQLKQLVPARVPDGTRFPTDEVQVLLEIQVGADGAVTAVRVVQGAGEPFDTAALQAARQFSFAPALLSTGEKVPVAVSFTLRIRRPAPPAVAKPIARRQPRSVRPVRFGGELLERGTRIPLVAVEVSALSGGKAVARSVTDDDGRFRLVVAATRFRLRAIPTGHQPLEVDVEAKEGELREERFYLETLGTGFETLVESERVQREVTRQVLPKALVERVPGTAGDTLKVVQILPGVSRSAFDGGQLILRGSSPGDSRIFLEGQEIPILFHFGGLRSSFNAVFLESVTFVPGNFGPEYGRATGGIIDIRVRDPARDTFRGQVDLNLFDAGLSLEGPVSKSWSVGGAFRRSYIDSILPAVLPDDAQLSFNSAPRYYDYQLLASWQPSSRQRLRLVGYGSLDKVALLFKRPQSDPAIRGNIDARIMFHNLYAGYSLRLSDRLSQESSLQLGFQQFRTEIGPEIFFDLDVTSFSFRTAWTSELASWLTARAGIDLLVQAARIDLNSPLRPLEGEDLPPPSTRQLYGVSSSTVLYNPALFVEAQVMPTKRFTILPSVRLDWTRANQSWTVDPRLTVRYVPWRDTVFKGAIGSYHQPPTPDQTAPETGNPLLLSPASMHLSLGVEQRLGGYLDVELTGFHKWLHRLAVRNPLYFVDPTAPPYLNGGAGRIYGVELLVRGRVGDRFQGWLAYTFQRSFRTDGPGADERHFDFDQPHLLTLVGSVRLGWGWSTGLRFRLVSGNPSTPVLGSVYDATSDTYVPLFGPNNSARQDTFHQLDMRVDKMWTFKTWKLSAYLDIQNLYNQGNQEGVSYSYDYRESQPMTGLPILPILGVKGEW